MVERTKISNDIEIIDFSERFYIEYWETMGVMWSRWRSTSRPCFSPELLDDILYAFSLIVDGSFPYANSLCYMVLQSEMKNIFNLGGDLNHFYKLIVEQDHVGMMAYAIKSQQLMQALMNGLQRNAITLALINGKCIGGGFEAALACDFRIAERSATFSFPEILLGIFPGMGGVSLLARLTTKKIFEDILYNGKTFTAEALFDLGLLDEVVDDGQAYNAVVARIRKWRGAHTAYANMLAVRKNAHPIDEIESQQVLEKWVECAMNLDKRRLLILQHAALKQTVEV